MPSKRGVQVGEHCVVVGGKYGGRQGIVTKFTPMKARVQFDGEDMSHLVDQSFVQSGFASSPSKAGDIVAIIKGTHVGRTGSIDRFTAQMVYVTLGDGTCPRVCQSSVVCINTTPMASTWPVSSVMNNTLMCSAPAVQDPAAARSPVAPRPTIPSCDTRQRPISLRHMNTKPTKASTWPVSSETNNTRMSLAPGDRKFGLGVNRPTVPSCDTRPSPVVARRPSATAVVHSSTRNKNTAPPIASRQQHRTVSPTPSGDGDDDSIHTVYQNVRVRVNDHDVEVAFPVRSSSSDKEKQSSRRQVLTPPRTIRISLEY